MLATIDVYPLPLRPPNDLDDAVRNMEEGVERSFWASLRQQVYTESGQNCEAAHAMPYQPSQTLRSMLAQAVSQFNGRRFAQFLRICEAFGFSLN